MKNIIRNSIKVALVTTAALSTLTMFSTVQASNLTLTLDNIDTQQGQLMVAVYQNQESYQTGTSAVASMIKPVTSTSHSMIFTDLMPGEYAVKVLHDENGNNTLDSNFLGVPSEGYGFSNNAGSFGPASFDEAKFTVDTDTAITIHLR
ncbi:DUF2141 domain-containing protein [Shewanella sp. D64]|uniref:DUF2141 domain-containing protein n=1 Tax=unclassified Shewanella TaxID=196818 RepID=UPI0022BA5CFE|nr:MULTISPECIES: DUF2141 domain-containing protein [unclassified Shewanella]MEC4728616.1 DUF2141 domain-containing protein [Shewanella sp. D64]MEC4737865.1 DUF2141 domain-containing protein [Shewanella sp. E94]WBJ93881.1 DUF2141 domain-containing protein [Shewanella sp. MTB7]